MSGGAKRGRGSSESVCRMVFTLTSHESFNCQVTTRKSIARERIPRILRIHNSWTSNNVKTILHTYSDNPLPLFAPPDMPPAIPNLCMTVGMGSKPTHDSFFPLQWAPDVSSTHSASSKEEEKRMQVILIDVLDVL